MPYTRITGSHNGREAIEYAMSEKGHNGNAVRNEYVTAVGMLPGDAKSYADQMQVYWDKASQKNKNQVRRIVTSYSKDELDPNDPKSALIAATIALEFVQIYYPGRQAVICVQKDGVGGCIHTHIIISNVSVLDYTGCTDEQTKFHYVAKNFDEVAKQYVELSMEYADKFDEKTMKAKIPSDIVTQYERRQRDQNREAEARGEAKPNYIWKDDLKNRIRQAMSEATSKEDYLKRLTSHGVEGTYKTSKKQGDYILYELTDTSGFKDKIPSNLKSKSYKIGSDYGIEALDAELLKNKQTTTQKTSEKTEKKQNYDDENAKKFTDWCRNNGYSFLDEKHKFDLDKYETAQKAYADYLKQPQEAPGAVLNDTVDKKPYDDATTLKKGKNEAVDDIQMKMHKKKPQEPTKTTINTPVIKPKTRRDEMLSNLHWDMQLVQTEQEDADEFSL